MNDKGIGTCRVGFQGRRANEQRQYDKSYRTNTHGRLVRGKVGAGGARMVTGGLAAMRRIAGLNDTVLFRIVTVL
ncbi:MAG: hypothetical protein IT425_01305 [Pirellulales bacterium]|nr:hypothetical protein [Pirellulales bacterium]